MGVYPLMGLEVPMIEFLLCLGMCLAPLYCGMRFLQALDRARALVR